MPEDVNNGYDEIPTTEIDTSANHGVVGKSEVAEIIKATGTLTSENFWMVVMILIMLGIGGGAVFWITTLYAQIAKLDVRIEQLEKDVEEAPGKAMEQLRATHQTIREIRGEVQLEKSKVQEDNAQLKETNEKLQEIEKSYEK